jgi:hypothetical protein
MKTQKLTISLSSIAKAVGGFPTLKAPAICETEPPACFSSKIHILWVVPFNEIWTIILSFSCGYLTNEAANTAKHNLVNIIYNGYMFRHNLLMFRPIL